jgi:ADP-ribose pyrophosphatase
MERQINSSESFRGRLITVRVDEVELENGHRTHREVVEHPGAVAIVPVLGSGEIVLVRQFRYAVDRTLLELPAGTREPDEAAGQTAARELREETGYAAGHWELLTRFFVSPGWCNEELIIYRARELTALDANLEEDEQVEVVAVRPYEIMGLMRDGEIADAKTVTGLLLHLQDEAYR